MDLMTITSALAGYYKYVLAIVVFLMLFYIKKTDRFHKYIVFYLCTMLIMEILSYVIAVVFKTNHAVLSIYSFIELVFFSILYYTFFIKKHFTAIWPMTIIGAVYILTEFCYYFIYKTFNPLTYQPYCKVADNIVVLIMALTALNSGVFSSDINKWRLFWFNSIIIGHFTFDTIFFLPFNFLVSAPIQSKFIFYFIHLVSLLGFYGYLSTLVFKNIFYNSRVYVK